MRFYVFLQSFFVVRLRTPLSAPATLTDTDPLIQCDLMESRDAFLNFAREKHCEFSSLRRAKYSTMVSLIELHSSTADKVAHTCNACRQPCDIRYHCTVCEDYDLCSKCHSTIKHEHRMERTDDANEAAANSDTPLSTQQQKQATMQKMLDTIRHAIQCRNANCIIKNCLPCKRFVQHTRDCTKASRNQCPNCNKILAPIWFHAKTCVDQHSVSIRRLNGTMFIDVPFSRLFSCPFVEASNRSCNDNVQQPCKWTEDESKRCTEPTWDQVTSCEKRL